MVYHNCMIYLPLYIEKKLKMLFPHAQDRYDFVSELVKDALYKMEEQQNESKGPKTVGGTIHLFTDGGSRGNPGQAAIGYVLEDPARGEILEEGGECIGSQTNNVAEYQALITGLKKAAGYHPGRLICHLDSELIVRQLSGDYRVKMPTLKPYFDEIQQLTGQFAAVQFKHIPRADNFRADGLVNKALDKEGY